MIQMLGVSTDNASNNDTMFACFTQICEENGVKFDSPNQRVRCLGHIINLAAQNTLKSLKAEGPDDESDLLVDNNENIASLGVVGKVSKEDKIFCTFHLEIVIVAKALLLPNCDSCGSLL